MLLSTIFFGSSEYCLPILHILQEQTSLVATVTKPDLLVGRKQIPTKTQVKEFSLRNNIPCFTPKDKEELLGIKEKLKQFSLDVAIVADYGMIIPKDIFSLPKLGTLNIHFSNLPKYRGASPVQYTILSGEKSAWITIIVMDETMDTGDIVWKKEVSLEGQEDTEHLYKKLFVIAASHLPIVLSQYANNELIPQKQDHGQATYTKRLTREDGFVPWDIIVSCIKAEQPKQEDVAHWSLIHLLSKENVLPSTPYVLLNAIRAFSPWPGVWTEVQITKNHASAGSRKRRDKQQITKRLKVIKAHVVQTTRFVPELVQLEGKKPVSFKQFCEGYGLKL